MKEVFLESTFFNELIINNGTINNQFDKYINTYTVTIEEDISYLDFHYELENPYSTIIIRNNDNLDNGSIVTITICNETNTKCSDYDFIINKEKVMNTIMVNDQYDLSINKTIHIETIIGSIIFLIILFIFRILFLHKNKNT